MNKVKNVLKTSLFVAAVQLIVSCSSLNVVTGNGNIMNSDRHLTGYKAIDACCGIDVVVTQSDTESVRVETDENIQEHIKTELKGETLKIFSDAVSLKSKTMKVYVNLKKLVNVDASSGSDVQSTNQIMVDSISLSSSSGAGITMKLNAKYVSCESSSGSDIKVEGQTTYLNTEASSGAGINTQSLMAENCKADASSGSTIKTQASNEVDANASSGSNIHVLGNPKTRNVDKSSGGSINFE